MSVVASPPLREMAETSARFESAHPSEIIGWAAERFGAGLVFTSSFEDAVLVHLVAKAAPAVEIVLLDTQYLFAETHWFAEELRRSLDLRLTIIRPLPDVVADNLWQSDIEQCCARRKVEPLARSLAGRDAWITGIRRDDGPSRANAPILSWDLQRNLVKINPLATWSDAHMDAYANANDLPKNPLTDRGYPSIGCWPCTKPVAPGEDRRAGRWSGSDKTECGLHL